MQSTSTQSTNAISAIGDTFLAPSKAFNGLKDNKGWFWLALALMLISAAAAQAIYYTSVDQSYFVEQQMNIIAASDDSTPAEMEMFEVSLIQQFPIMWILSSVSVFIVIPIILSIYAVYFSLIAKQDPNCNKKFGDWFGFTVFMALPNIFTYLGSIILVLTAQSGEISQGVLTFSSLNQLFFGFEPGHALAGLLESPTIFTFWSLFLIYIGLKSWTNFSDAKAWIFALLPSILLYGIWFLIATV